MAEKKAENPAVAVAHAEKDERTRVITLSTGHKARLMPVATSLLESVTSQIKDPEVPMWFNESKEREEPNPHDPNYLRAVQETTTKRGTAFMDALILFGVELVDGLPEDDTWLKKLHLLEKMGQIDLGDIDLSDPIALEFAYKKFVVVSAEDYDKLTALSGVTEQGVAAQAETFPSS